MNVSFEVLHNHRHKPCWIDLQLSFISELQWLRVKIMREIYAICRKAGVKQSTSC
jgi:hypothetical protein